MKEFLIPTAVFAAGFASSFINIMAGGGSVLTLGLMLLLGLDGPVANGTNRIGLLIAGISGAAAYTSEKTGNLREGLVFGLVALPGAVIGSVLAIQLSTAVFQRVLALVMVFIIITLFLPQSHPAGLSDKRKFGKSWIYPILFCIGVYGGFVQAGVGFLIMASLRHILDMDLVTVNMYKNLIVLVYTVPVLFIFGATGNIHWTYALALAMGNALGAWTSVKVSVRKGEKIIRIALGLAILLMAVKFLIPF